MNARDELALTIHTHHCIESVHNEDCMFWADDHESAEAVRTAGYSKPRTITYVVVDRDGGLVTDFPGGDKEAAQSFADEWTANCKSVDIDWDYRVAAVTEATK